MVEFYSDKLVLYACRRLGDIQDAEDVAQDVFVRAFGERSKRKQISHVGPYLYRMVSNACIDLLRKRKRRGPQLSLDMTMVQEIPSREKNALEMAIVTEEMHRSEELVSCLSAKQAEVVRLRVFADLTLGEIAETVGCSVNTVCSRLRYGFRNLRKIVSERSK